MTHPYLLPLLEQFAQHANPTQAAPMAAYMRDQFPFLGIKSPQRAELTRHFVAAHGLPPVEALETVTLDLWALPEREYQYVAMDLLWRQRRSWQPELVELLVQLITTKSWWDTVDLLAGRQVGELFLRFPAVKEVWNGRLRQSDNLWLRRTALLFQLHYKKKTDADLLFATIGENLGSDEFFINKAIGWALREYSKTDAAAVVAFVAHTDLHPLSEREALKWLQGKGLVGV
jgi:3-methyladenine DNA glycosylase AlkD